MRAVNGGRDGIGGMPRAMTTLPVIVIAIRKVTMHDFPMIRKKKVITYGHVGVCRYTHRYPWPDGWCLHLPVTHGRDDQIYS